MGGQVQKRTGIVARCIAGFIDGGLDARARQRNAQRRSANAGAHNHHMLCHVTIVPAQRPPVFLNLAAVLRFLRRRPPERLLPHMPAGMMGAMNSPSKLSRAAKPARASLSRAIGRAVSRFQDSSNAFDDVAAEILAIDRRDLAGMTMPLFRGAAAA